MSDPVTMTVDDALTTTRAVRKRLDLTKPVPRDVLLDCLQLAFQAPNGSNRQLWQWVVVDDAETRAQMAAIYNGALADYAKHSTAPPIDATSPANQRLFESVDHLKAHYHEVPVLVVPAIRGRLDDAPSPSRRTSGVRCSLRCGASCSRCAPAASAAAGRPRTSSTRRRWPTSWASRTPSTRRPACS